MINQVEVKVLSELPQELMDLINYKMESDRIEKEVQTLLSKYSIPGLNYTPSWSIESTIRNVIKLIRGED